MSFFIRSKAKRKNKQQGDVQKKKKYKSKLNAEIASDSENDKDSDFGGTSGEESDVAETAQEKRLRLERMYIAQLEAEEADEAAGEEEKRAAVAHRLQQDHLEQSGKLHHTVADLYQVPSPDLIRRLRGHKLSLTCLAVSSSGRHCYTGAKDCCIIKWDLESGRRLHIVPGGRKGTEPEHNGHTEHVLCLAVSTDEALLASGDCNNLIYIWRPSNMERLHVFKGHRGPVSGVVFRKDSHQLFSCSHDRCVKVWNVADFAYVETLFGHQENVSGIDCLARERAVTCGGRDGSVRVWKIIEESQLLFHGHSGSIDCISLINEEYFVTGADDNSLALWTVRKKRPLVTVRDAHGEGTGEQMWITTVAALRHSDLVASGCRDGCVRLWKCGPDFKSLTLLNKIELIGFVNALQFCLDGTQLLAAVGQEHKLGRWWREKQAKNTLCVIPLNKSTEDINNGETEVALNEHTKN